MAKRLIVDEVPKAIASQFAPLDEKLSSLQFDEGKQRQLLRSEMDSWLEALNKQAESETESGSKSEEDKTIEIPALAELRKQLSEQAKIAEQMKQRVDAAEKLAADERSIREKIADQQRVAGMEEKVLQELRGKVRPNTERQLLALLRNDGMLVEDKENNQFLLKSKDEYGLDTNVGIPKAIPDIIRQNYPHFEEVRPGTGTSAMPGSRDSGVTSGGKWFGNGTQAPSTEAMLDPNNRAEMMRELDTQLKRS